MSSENSDGNSLPKQSSEEQKLRQMKIKELGKIVTGSTPSTKEEENYGGAIPFIRVSDFNNDPFIKNTDKKLTQAGYDKVKNREIPEGSIMVSCIGNGLGKTAFATDSCVTNQQINSIVPRDEYDNWYIYYKITENRDRLQQFAGGSAQPILSKTKFGEIEVEIHPPEQQKKIGEILSNIDRKIEVNNHISEVLDKTAQAIFTQFFIDFGPYEEFKESESGKIPEKFEMSRLEDVLSFQRGYSYSGDELIDEDSDKDITDGYPMINLGNINPGGGYRSEKIKYCDNIPKERYLVSPGDLVISHTDMTQDQEILGSPIIVPDLEKEPMLFSHHLYLIKDTDLPKEYLYYYFLSPYFKPKAEKFASGTTVLSFSSKITSDVEIPVPPEKDLKQYVDIVRPMFKRKEKIRKENAYLTDLRDTLLPKLMSGEIRVNDINLDDLEVGSEV